MWVTVVELVEASAHWFVRLDNGHDDTCKTSFQFIIVQLINDRALIIDLDQIKRPHTAFSPSIIPMTSHPLWEG